MQYKTRLKNKTITGTYQELVDIISEMGYLGYRIELIDE